MEQVKNKPTYRMSGIGHCPRALSAWRLGYPTEPAPSWLKRAAQEGNKHEVWIKEQLQTDGYEVFDEQLELKLTSEELGFNLVGHIDGKVKKNGTVQLLEIKSMSQYEFDRWMRGRFDVFPNYAAQLTCYMHITGCEQALYLVKNRSSGYVDKQNLIKTPLYFGDLLSKIAHIEECVALGTLVDINYDPDSIECRRCGYKELCIPVPMEFNTVSEKRLLEACEKWRQGQLMLNEGDQLVKEAKEVFTEQTEASGQKKWRFNELLVNKIDVKESFTYKKEKLLELFTEEQLKPASEIKMPYSYVKITELREEER